MRQLTRASSSAVRRWRSSKVKPARQAAFEESLERPRRRRMSGTTYVGTVYSASYAELSAFAAMTAQHPPPDYEASRHLAARDSRLQHSGLARRTRR